MPLALIVLFALIGWGLFCWRLYRDGKRKAELKSLIEINAGLIKTIKDERKLYAEQLKLVRETGRVDADTINGAFGRLRGKGQDAG